MKEKGSRARGGEDVSPEAEVRLMIAGFEDRSLRMQAASESWEGEELNLPQSLQKPSSANTLILASQHPFQTSDLQSYKVIYSLVVISQ